ncbi:3-oxoacyl-[acyl-carrier protein] reductase [Desulfatibacillum alkenivorans DSM 16219]|uniref:3-oxoacyl-[acyl-carrier protein] reductase n=1 Tax=Desulfatibacillum alkenivorans DSM 16219 TaxID=1121393 RepID=A0A1M6P078_9BACT|nr:3-oxoacyl-ACP reductase [Desulfatibacillum alkenivorans]SHK01387.1 3-oxoacyl-[acyl-carrier protein] reductase [Desulfatibacillum alkenivorans DSM 16219]
MGDMLLELGKKDAARKVVKNLGIPLSLPQELSRPAGPWEEMPLLDVDAAVGHLPGSELAPQVARALGGMGVLVHAAADSKKFSHYQKQGAARGRLAKALDMDAKPEGLNFRVLIFDATGVSDPAELEMMYEFFHTKIRSLSPCGRLIVLGRPADQLEDVSQAAASRALLGFVKSAGKEIGKKGATSQAIYVEKGAEDRLEPVLRFFLSDRSAYVSGQMVRVSARVKALESFTNIRPLDGKIALVTGAARGIGEQIARTMAGEGARVIVMDRPGEENLTAKLAREINGSALNCDITASDAAKAIKDHIAENYGKKGLDVIVHNAGVTRDKMLANMDADRWNMVMSINLLALIASTRELLEIMPDNGRIVCLSSIAGIAGNVGQTNYAASKAGVIGFVEALAPTVADRGITVNAVAPGFIETQMTAAIPFATREAGRRLASLSQGGLPQDVAQVVTFLASPQASGITGGVLRICGQNFIGA